MAEIMQENNHTEKTVYKKSDFYYELPEELIAQTPAEPRDSAGVCAMSSDACRTARFFAPACVFVEKQNHRR